jgi:hypothetical protein
MASRFCDMFSRIQPASRRPPPTSGQGALERGGHEFVNSRTDKRVINVSESANENQELYRRVTQEAFSKGDLNVIDELLSCDFREHEPAPVIRPGRDLAESDEPAESCCAPQLRDRSNQPPAGPGLSWSPDRAH